MWYSQLPAWVTDGDFDADELSAIVANHTGTVVGHYAGQVYVFKVMLVAQKLTSCEQM